MNLDDFNYQLPEDLIAKTPVSPRDHSRLMVVEKTSGKISHHHFYDLPKFLRPPDYLVMNNTKVFPARIFAKDRAGRKFEILLLEKIGPHETWSCLVRPGKKIEESRTLVFSDGKEAELRRTQEGFAIGFPPFSASSIYEWLETQGEPPLPPYLKREATLEDRITYQTVFAKDPGSVAAPTAGLHFTPSLLESLKLQGVGTGEVTLHVGQGTFATPRHQNLDLHEMHEESFSVPNAVLSEVKKTKTQGGRVVCVGTTSLRSLESVSLVGASGRTRLFIRPGYSFEWADGLITNFHLPKSTLFILVSAFLGLENTRRCYEEAIRERYRFFSYGDAMLVI